MMQYQIQRTLFWVCAYFVMGLSMTSLARAQVPNTAPTNNAVPGAPVIPANGVPNTGPRYFEWAITIVMCGLAIFAVCRSSRRN